MPVTDDMTPEEIAGDYEKATGVVIVRTFRDLDPDAVPAVLVAGHGRSPGARTPTTRCTTRSLSNTLPAWRRTPSPSTPRRKPLPRELHDKHFFRKHGAGAYYGQPKG